MDKRTQLSNLTGLARRAGKITSGEDLVTKSIQNGSAKLVFLANDASSNLTKKIKDKSSYYHVALTEIFSEHELSAAIGQNRKVIAILDAGFAKKMEQLMND
ncbi:YlxQ-related RNA-binding protein [Lactococcus termiticola]|uniref:50S ribosomal protein L7ae n=1 Tax=Lactococcus termiticola TaxID=2169526 RepID=A0A2R5HHM1_9LACT|nr:YlxQ-related RNA-binding protein [Lactococcus termiticola]GBG97553.1 50S ribosomal protein L7ae [Lactococcus termiticola]